MRKVTLFIAMSPTVISQIPKARSIDWRGRMKTLRVRMFMGNLSKISIQLLWEETHTIRL